MAFSPTSDAATQVVQGGSRCYSYTFTTAEGAAGSETELTGLPPVGRIKRVIQSRTSGTAANHQPDIYTATGGTGVKLYQATSAVVATDIDDPGATGQPIPYKAVGSSLFYRCIPDAGADNVFVVTVYIIEGWE